MALLTYRLAMKLRVHSNELQRITEKANERLSKYEVFDLSRFHDVTWALKESSTRLTRCLSLLDGILLQIGRLRENEWEKSNGDLIFAVDAVDAVELSARLALAVLEAKLKHMKDLWNMVPATDRVGPFRRVTESSPATNIPQAKDDGVSVRITDNKSLMPVYESALRKINAYADTKLVQKWMSSSESSSEDEPAPDVRKMEVPCFESSDESSSEDEPVPVQKLGVPIISMDESSDSSSSEDETVPLRENGDAPYQIAKGDQRTQ